MTPFALRVLGGFDLSDPMADPIALATRKGWALLAALIVSQGRALAREDLAAQLWPRVSDSQARASLRQELALLRKGLLSAGFDGLLAQKDRISCRFPAGTVDLLEFERGLDRADRDSHRAALALYQGEFMAGLTLRAEPFEDWLWLERIRLRNRAQAALISLLEHDVSVGDDSLTAQTAQKLIEVEPTQEQGYRALMQVHLRAGNRADALQVFRRCQKTLREDLDTEPSQETALLADQIRAQTRPASQSARKTIAGMDRPGTDRPGIDRPGMDWAGMGRVRKGRAAVLCFALPGMDHSDAAPEDHLKAQFRLRNRVQHVVTSAGGVLMAGPGDRVVAVFCSGTCERDCETAIGVALLVVATPVLAGDAVSIRPGAGLASGEVLLDVPLSGLQVESDPESYGARHPERHPGRPPETDGERLLGLLAGAPLGRASRRLGMAGAGTLVAGLDVAAAPTEQYDLTMLPPAMPPDPARPDPAARIILGWTA